MSFNELPSVLLLAVRHKFASPSISPLSLVPWKLLSEICQLCTSSLSPSSSGFSWLDEPSPRVSVIFIISSTTLSRHLSFCLEVSSSWSSLRGLPPSLYGYSLPPISLTTCPDILSLILIFQRSSLILLFYLFLQLAVSLLARFSFLSYLNILISVLFIISSFFCFNVRVSAP